MSKHGYESCTVEQVRQALKDVGFNDEEFLRNSKTILVDKLLEIKRGNVVGELMGNGEEKTDLPIVDYHDPISFGPVKDVEEALTVELPLEIVGEEDGDSLIDFETLKKQEETPSPDVAPAFGSERWKEYVMTKFRDDELIDGLPTCDGCRRVVEELVGPILSSSIVSSTPPNVQNNGTATVVVSLEIRVDNESHPCYNRAISIDEIADVNVENTVHPYNLHKSATASTRAEGRALRKILRLSNICTAEEVVKADANATGLEWTPDEPISDSQIRVIDMLCRRLNVNVKDFISCGRKVYSDINEVTKTTAQKMIQELNKIQQDVKLKPKNVGEYKENWQS